jgi:AhpC/TSA family
MTIVLTETTETVVPDARVEGERLWLTPRELETATGWSSRPEGLCRGSVCVPIPAGRERELLRGDRIDAAALWRHRGQPLAHSADGGAWVLGTAAADRAAALGSLQAPDFTLPDRTGRPHSLSEHRGKKVLLVSWASW